MGTVWSAVLVGGGLAGALFVWLLRGGAEDTGNGDAEQKKDAPVGEATAPGSDQGGGGGLSPGPSRREPVTKPDLQESNGCLISETKDLGNLKEAAWILQSSSGEDGNCDHSRQHVPSGRFPDTESLAPSEIGISRGYSEVSRNESPPKGQETSAKVATCFAGKLASSNLIMDRAKEEVSLARLDSQDPDDHGDWEMLSRHSSWGDVGLSGSLEAPMLGPNQGMDCGRSTVAEARGQEVNMKTQKVVPMSSESQQVNVRFQVHYITNTDVQFIAVTGDHENLGRWNTYIPLQNSKEGFWSHSVSLPADTVVEWKFVVVENGEVTRWEECSNRFLQTGHEDKVVQEWWGFH
ncbi:starch-binding domain-containing protein 1 [Choloepus didactylus]|uniref:starch-binding domain-containing protein 1 n=1 Tax=Choloepus didactylus TaxID=27675 RepID=UPI0018A0264D|nr:starch-binding domain-containing protein 1 [Choloepus didactylus]